MAPLQTPGGIELLVIALILVVPVVIVGMVAYVLYRIARTPSSGTVPTDRAGSNVTHSRESDPEESSPRYTDPEESSPRYIGPDAPRPSHTEPDEVRPPATEPDWDPPPASRELDPSTRRLVDWVAVLALLLIGVTGIISGGFLALLGERDRIVELVEDDVIESDVLSDEALVDVSHTLAVWGGWGLVAAGVLVLVAGLGFAAYRLRLDGKSGTDSDSSPPMVSNALVGAVVTVFVSFIPLSGVLGGAVAGYLQYGDRWDGFSAGILAGLFVGLPVFVLLGTIAAGLFLSGLPVLGLVVLAGLLFALVFGIALSGLGGYVGGYLVTRQ